MENLETLIEKYLRDCETIKTLDKKTIKAYRIDLTQFCTFMLKYPDFTSKTAINEYISTLHKKYQPKTVKRKIATIKAYTLNSEYLQN